VLTIENLSVVFSIERGTVQAIQHLNLSLTTATTTGLVGESGSGKSVTALAIMGLLPGKHSKITSGHIWFDHPVKGKIDLLHQDDQTMQAIRGKYISMIFQEPMSSLNPVQRCGLQVGEVILQHHHTRVASADAKALQQQVLSLFAEVKLDDPVKVYKAWPHELSGGQRQRVMIAMAIACRPLLLIADEPTTALDVTVQQGILSLLKQLQDRHGMGMLFVSHDLSVISEVATTAAVMYKGQIVEAGAAREILENPSHPYTKALIACRPPLTCRPHKLAVVADFLTTNASIHVSDHVPRVVTDTRANYQESQDAKARQHHVHAPADEIRKMQHKEMYDCKPVLEVRQLQTSFVSKRNFVGKATAWHKALKPISFDVYPGETLGLVGESGCGKTTLGRSILRLVRPDAGKVLYKGVDITGLGVNDMRRLRPKLQIIFQDPFASLTPGMTVGQAIIEPMRVHGILKNDRQRTMRVIELLEQVGLGEKHFYRYPHEFSGGQRQRICIARALSVNPECVICDEAVSALDVSVQAQVLNLLNDLKRTFQLTYIFISHDLSVVKYMSDRIIVMKDGEMIELGEADQLYARPENVYTRNLLSAIPGATYPPSFPQ